MSKIPFFLILFLCLALNPCAQPARTPPPGREAYLRANTLYNSPRPTAKSDSLALAYFRLAIGQMQQEKSYDSILFDSYVKAGILATGRKEDLPALGFFLQALELQRAVPAIPDSLTFQPLLFAGSAYYELNNLDSAQFFYREAESLLSRFPGLEGEERLYNKAGVIYYETGDYRKSIQYFNKALSLVEDGPARKYFIVNYRNNIASAMRKLGNYTAALETYKSLLAFGINQDALMHNMGVTLMDAGDYPEALRWLRRVKYDDQAKYNDLARASLCLGRLDNAAEYLAQATRIYEKLQARKNDYDHGMTLRWKGQWMMKKGMPDQAVDLFQQAIIQLDPSFNDPRPSQNPDSFRSLVNSFALFDLLREKASAQKELYLRFKDPAFLRQAFNTYAAAISLANRAGSEFGSEEARLFLAGNVQAAYDEVIALALRLFDLLQNKYYLQQAFAYAESSKASALQAGIHELSLQNLPGIPADLIGEERKLRAGIAKYNIRMQGESDPARLSAMDQERLDQEIRLSVVQDRLLKDPKYRQLINQGTRISPDSIRPLLDKGTCLLSYYYLNQSLLCFYVSREDFGYALIPANQRLQEQIFFLRRSLGTIDATDKKMTAAAEKDLYNFLISPVKPYIARAKRLIIIPHNDLSYIPFECLRHPEKGDFLLKDYAVSYLYSANFLSGDIPGPAEEYSVLAMAPFASAAGNKTLSRLEHSARELEHLRGKILLDKAATKPAFIASSSDFPVIHLATHAVANDQDPLQSYIEFYGDERSADTVHRLYEQEIYHLDLRAARLVLLSACETGHGKLIHGEGIMSLSRAFAYAGSRSVITSLWKADDAATAFLMQRLHSYLQDGWEKDDALRKAKIDYLENGEIEAAHQSEAYWAPFVLIGDVQPLQPKDKWPLWLGGGLILLFLLFVYLKKNQARKPGPVA